MHFFHQYHNTTQIIHNQQILYEPHLHYEIEIIALYKGSAILTVDGNELRMEAGDFLLVFPNTIHSYTTQSNVEVGKFIFSPEALPELKTVFSSMQPRNPVISGRAAKDLLALSKEILYTYQQSSPPVQKAYLLLLTGKLLDLCEPEKRQQGSRDMIGQVLDYCRTHYSTRLTQRDVAQALHISESHLSHIFCCKMKINFCSYINILRINEACKILAESDKSIIDIAEESGFSSLRSFNRAFLRHRGMTPTEYRKNLLHAN